MNAWNALPPHARIWFYGADRKINQEEKEKITTALDAFCADWAAHGAKHSCGYTILHDQIILLGVDEAVAAASGCSIDTSVHLFQEIDTTFGLDLFNRLRVYTEDNGGVSTLMANEVKAQLESGTLDASTPVVDALVATKEAVESELIKPLNQTWLKRYV